MPDYAISAVGQAAGDTRLLCSGLSNEVIRFEEIASRENKAWDLSDDSWDQIKIIQNSSSEDSPLKNEKTPWKNIANRTLDKLDDIQHRWGNTMRNTSSLDASAKEDITGENGIKVMREELQNLLREFHRLSDGQVRLTMVTSVATMAKNSITTLYRQQG